MLLTLLFGLNLNGELGRKPSALALCKKAHGWETSYSLSHMTLH
jgi:hypothetical protein